MPSSEVSMTRATRIPATVGVGATTFTSGAVRSGSRGPRSSEHVARTMAELTASNRKAGCFWARISSSKGVSPGGGLNVSRVERLQTSRQHDQRTLRDRTPRVGGARSTFRWQPRGRDNHLRGGYISIKLVCLGFTSDALTHHTCSTRVTCPVPPSGGSGRDPGQLPRCKPSRFNAPQVWTIGSPYPSMNLWNSGRKVCFRFFQ